MNQNFKRRLFLASIISALAPKPIQAATAPSQFPNNSKENHEWKPIRDLISPVALMTIPMPYTQGYNIRPFDTPWYTLPSRLRSPKFQIDAKQTTGSKTTQGPITVSSPRARQPSTKKLIRLLPLRPHRPLKLLFCDQLSQIQLSDPRPQVHVPAPHHLSLVYNLIRYIKQQHDWCCQICLEKVFRQRFGARDGGAGLGDYGGEAGPELGDEHEHVEEETDPGADDAGLGAEG